MENFEDNIKPKGNLKDEELLGDIEKNTDDNIDSSSINNERVASGESQGEIVKEDISDISTEQDAKEGEGDSLNEENTAYNSNSKGKNGTKEWLILALILVGIVALALFITIFVKPNGGNNGNGDLPNGTTQNSTVIYNNFTFKKELIGWSTLIQVGDNVYDLRMKYNPQEIDHFKIENHSKIVDRLLNSDLVLITMDPFIESETALAGLEISKILNPRKEDTGILGIPTVIGVTYIPEGYQNKAVLVVDCQNATKQLEFDVAKEAALDSTIELNSTKPKVSVIKFEVSKDINRVFIDGDCIRILGTNSSNVYKQADLLSYAILNIVPSDEFVNLDLVEPFEETENLMGNASI